MDVLNREDLERLIERTDDVCVSLYMPTERMGRETRQNPIRFKNLLGKVERRLAEDGLRPPVVKNLMATTEELLEDNDFWQHQSDGLAAFSSASLFRSYRLPIDMPEMAVVSTGRFHIKPLLRLLAGDEKFFVLALSLGGVRLLQGTHYSVNEIDLDGTGVPSSLKEALRFDQPESQLQFHTGTGARSGGPEGDRAAVFHGQGVGIDEKKENILRYFRKIDHGLRPLLRGESAPMVLAGVEYLFALYREANSYAGLVDEGITGNPEELHDGELHRRGWGIVSSLFLAEREEAARRFGDLSKTEKTSNDLRRIVPEAANGRVETLFVARDRQRWGTFDAEGHDVRVHDRRRPDDEDLLDSVAAQTVLHGGKVYPVGPDEVPGDHDAAVIYRWP